MKNCLKISTEKIFRKSCEKLFRHFLQEFRYYYLEYFIILPAVSQEVVNSITEIAPRVLPIILYQSSFLNFFGELFQN